MFVRDLLASPLNDLRYNSCRTATLNMLKTVLEKFLHSAGDFEAAPFEFYEQILTEHLSKDTMALVKAIISMKETEFARTLALKFDGMLECAIKVLQDCTLAISVDAAESASQGEHVQVKVPPEVLAKQKEFREVLIQKVRSLFTQYQEFFLGSASEVATYFFNFPDLLAKALDDGLVSDDSTFNESFRAFGQFVGKHFLEPAFDTDFEQPFGEISEHLDILFCEIILLYSSKPLIAPDDFIVISKAVGNQLARPLNLLDQEYSVKLRNLAIEPFKKEFLALLRSALFDQAKRALTNRQRNWSKTNDHAREYINRPQFDISKQRHVSFAIFWRLWDLIKSDALKKNFVMIGEQIWPEKTEAAEIIAEFLQKRLLATIFNTSDWEGELGFLSAQELIKIELEISISEQAKRLGLVADMTTVEKFIFWLKNQMLFTDKQKRKVDLWHGIYETSEDISEVITKSVVEKELTIPVTKFNSAAFIQELGDRFEQLLLNDIEVISELSPSCPQVAELLVNFSFSLIESLSTSEFKKLESFDEIVYATEMLFDNQVLTPYMSMFQFAPEKELLDEILTSKRNEFRALCQEVLQKHFVSEFTVIKTEADYLSLMSKLGLDPNRPEDLYDSACQSRLSTLNLNIHEPAFQAFMKEMFALVWSRVDVPEDKEPVFEPPIEPGESSSVYVSAVSTPIKGRTGNNSAIMVKLAALLIDEASLEQLKKIISERVDERFFDAIVKSLKELSANPAVFNAVPQGAKMAPKAQKQILDCVKEACRALESDESESEVAVQVALFLNSKVLTTESKASAVELWHAEIDNILETKSQLSTKSVSFAAENENSSVEFAYNWAPRMISNFVAEIIDDYYMDDSLVPPFPFKSASGKDWLPGREQLENTAEYMRQHGNTEHLKLEQRKLVTVKGVDAELKSLFADVDSVILDQIVNVYKEAVDETFRITKI